MSGNDLEALLAHASAQVGLAEQEIKGESQFLAVARLEQETVLFVMNQFRQGVGVGGNDRQATGHCFHGRETLQLGLRRNSEDGGRAAQRQQVVIVYIAQEADAAIQN